ncbi:MAG: N-glycosylase/DNA lyase, partial [Candidatus Gracilibacteria bacterium]|nr:N-glycosylase/DNA lyase [Candidatus Gracilibacteria bacterium]
MNELIKILSAYSLKDAIIIEENDRQFLAVKNLITRISSKEYIFPLIIANSLVSYQLSGTGEDYWEEFCNFALEYKFSDKFSFDELLKFFNIFLPNSKGNKRILNMKIPRLNKTETLFEKINGKERYIYENLVEFQNILAKNMKQDKDSKTILFAIKMFHYAARIVFGEFIKASFEIGIPLDSRIAKIEQIYNIPKINS